MTYDPVDLIADELLIQRETGAPTAEAAHAGAFLVLSKLHAEGWRIIKPATVDLTNDLHGSDVYVVAEEWKP